MSKRLPVAEEGVVVGLQMCYAGWRRVHLFACSLLLWEKAGEPA